MWKLSLRMAGAASTICEFGADPPAPFGKRCKEVGGRMPWNRPLSPYLLLLLLTILMHDTENRLLRTGTPTNTWSVGKPIFDIEYADDTLLFGITTPQLESMSHALEHEAMVYGLTLNMSKSEHLIQPGQEGKNGGPLSPDPGSAHARTPIMDMHPL